jgi:glucokinase
MAEVEGPPVVGIDLGGTKILSAVIDAGNRVLGRAKRPTPAQEGGAAILAAVVECVEEAIRESGIPLDGIEGVGIGSPGPLDSRRGVIHFSANMAVRDFPLGPELGKRLGKPVLLQNDVRVGGYGEYRLGAGRGYDSLLAAFVGTGIGGCLVLDGRIVEGATGNAGEIGHIPIKNRGPECGCGRRGCIEAVASRSAMTARIRKAIRRGTPSVLAEQLGSKSGDRLKSKDLAAAYAAGDAVVVREVHRAAHYLGRGLGGLVNVFGPQIIIIGGGVADALGQPYIDRVEAAARAQTLADPEHTIRYALAALGDDAGILGASLLARERFAPDPAAGSAIPGAVREAEQPGA